MIGTILDITQKLIIIKNANLDDAEILDSNYKRLIRNTRSDEEQQQLLILQDNVQHRIKELQHNN